MTEPARVTNCRFIFMCFRTWEDLAEIKDNAGVRYCGRCDQSVHLCTIETIVEHVEKGRCVALAGESQEPPSENKGRKLLGLVDIKSLNVSEIP